MKMRLIYTDGIRYWSEVLPANLDTVKKALWTFSCVGSVGIGCGSMLKQSSNITWDKFKRIAQDLSDKE